MHDRSTADSRDATCGPTAPQTDPRAMHPPRLRHDGLSARTVFIAPGRALRPTFSAGPGGDAVADCPFCAGNESRTPPAVMRHPESAEGAWHVRIIPNQFPVVQSATDRPPVAMAGERAAHGVHEVVVESAAHDRTILAVDPPRWRDVWDLCRRRLAALADRDDLAWATVFKNSGPAAGSSVDHLHSQLIALDFVPPAMRAELAAAADDDVFGDLLRRGRADGRIVAESGDLVALVPPAPRQPFETWILPRDPEPHFHATSRGRTDALADLTRLVVGRLDRLAPGADFNWWLHSAPFHDHGPATGGRWHWHLEILPRLNGLAGFELGTGCHITTAGAADSARRLRDA